MPTATVSVSRSELADYLGLSHTKVNELAASGVIVRIERGKFDLRRFSADTASIKGSLSHNWTTPAGPRGRIAFRHPPT